MQDETILKRDKTILVLMNIYNLPPMSRSIVEIIKLLDDKSTSVTDLNKVISKDQSLVSKILLIANSPFYGLQRKVNSIEYAVLILGFAEIRNIISVLSMIESFKNKTDNYLDQKEFWLHSFLVGTVSKKIAGDLGIANTGEIFIAGFLHDVGISVLHRFFHSNLINICNLVEAGSHDYRSAELEVLGMSHSEIGNFLLERWNFPERMCDLILHHHEPSKCINNAQLAAVIHLADYMTQNLELGNFKFDKNIQLDMEAMKLLRFNTEEEIKIFIESYRETIIQNIDSARPFA